MSSRRRSSRLKTNEPDAESSSQTGNDAHDGTTTIALPPDFPIEQLKAVLPEGSTPENPTPEFISQLYYLVLDLADQVKGSTAERDDAVAKVQRLEVDLDQAIVEHDNETARVSGELQQAVNENASLKAEKAELGRWPLSSITSRRQSESQFSPQHAHAMSCNIKSALSAALSPLRRPSCPPYDSS